MHCKFLYGSCYKYNVHNIPYCPESKSPSKISPLPSLTHKFLHRNFYLVYKPPPLLCEICTVSKINAWRWTEALLFVVQMVCLCHLSALSTKYHQEYAIEREGEYLTHQYTVVQTWIIKFLLAVSKQTVKSTAQ